MHSHDDSVGVVSEIPLSVLTESMFYNPCIRLIFLIKLVEICPYCYWESNSTSIISHKISEIWYYSVIQLKCFSWCKFSDLEENWLFSSGIPTALKLVGHIVIYSESAYCLSNFISIIAKKIYLSEFVSVEMCI